jgi:hypothetical protein
MSQQFNVSPDNLWMAVDYTPTSKTVVHKAIALTSWTVSVSGQMTATWK